VKDSHSIEHGVLLVRAVPGGKMQNRKATSTELQLSLFEELPFYEVAQSARKKRIEHFQEPTVLEFVRARFEYGPEMTKEEYKHFVRVLVNASIKRME
jgi:hypothetical protein